MRVVYSIVQKSINKAKKTGRDPQKLKSSKTTEEARRQEHEERPYQE